MADNGILDLFDNLLILDILLSWDLVDPTFTEDQSDLTSPNPPLIQKTHQDTL